MAVATKHAIPASVDPIEVCYERGWTDGLPVVPPTVERAEAMLAGTTLARDVVVARIPPSWAEATTEKIAINSVMAGCRPDYLPVVIAAARAMTHPSLNLNGMQCSTHLATPLVVAPTTGSGRPSAQPSVSSSSPPTLASRRTTRGWNTGPSWWRF